MNKTAELILAIVLLIIGWRLEKLAKEMEDDDEKE